MILHSVKDLVPAGSDLGVSPNVSGWHSELPEFAAIVGGSNPTLIVEVGSYVGQSALRFAELCPTSIIICVDTFLGSIEHMGESPDYRLPVRFGRPMMYEQFLANVSTSNYADRIFPLCQTSLTAAKLIRTMPVVPDMCYIDGPHDVAAVYWDLRHYWGLLRKGGVMFGDDLNGTHPGVVCGLEWFCDEEGLKFEERQPFWVLRKTR